MGDQIQPKPKQQPQATIQESGAPDVLSVARRRIVKTGLTSAAAILTLKSKPLLANGNCGKSMSMSAAHSHGVVNVFKGCKDNDFNDNGF